MLADVMRGQGYLVVDLGGSTPVESFASATAEADTLRAVGISAATTEALDSATDAIHELRPLLPGTPILLGGPAVGAESVARQAGADGWAGDAAEAIAVLEGIIGR
jgi:5-methyltetrahydrofolate--homocysteine methyltransferase